MYADRESEGRTRSMYAGECRGESRKERALGKSDAPSYNKESPSTNRPEPAAHPGCLRGMNHTGPMDGHTLTLLEFDKVRELLASYAACSLGKELARDLEPLTDAERIRAEIELVTEMTLALGENQAPPFGGLHDVRLLARRAAIGSMLTAEQLLEVSDTLSCTGAMYRYRSSLS